MATFTRTLETSGGDYDSFQGAYDAVSTIAGTSDLATGGHTVIFENSGGGTFNGRLTCDGITQDASNRVIFRSSGGTKPTLVPSAGSGDVVSLRDSFVQFEGIDFQNYASGGSDNIVGMGDSSHTAEGCAFESCSFSGAAGLYVARARFWNTGTATNPIRFRDCLIDGTNMSAAFDSQMIFNNAVHYIDLVNCTIHAPGGIYEYQARGVNDALHLRSVNCRLSGYSFGNDLFTFDSEGDTNGTIDFTGSAGNFYLSGTGSWEGLGTPNPVTLTDSTSPGAGDWMIVETVASDLRLVDDADNDVLDQGVGPGANILVSDTDFFGNARSGATCDPGHHQVTAASGGNSGTLTATEADDTTTGSGSLDLEGSAAVTESGDTSTASGALGVTASASLTEVSDTASSAGDINIGATATLDEDADSSSASAGLAIEGAAALTEDADTVAASGQFSPANEGTASLAEDSDTISASGTLSVRGTAVATEANDTASASGVLSVEGSASLTEAGDTVTATGGESVAVPATARVASVVEHGLRVSGVVEHGLRVSSIVES